MAGNFNIFGLTLVYMYHAEIFVSHCVHPSRENKNFGSSSQRGCLAAIIKYVQRLVIMCVWCPHVGRLVHDWGHGKNTLPFWNPKVKETNSYTCTQRNISLQLRNKCTLLHNITVHWHVVRHIVNWPNFLAKCIHRVTWLVQQLPQCLQQFTVKQWDLS
jgi:hypothetical protein